MIVKATHKEVKGDPVWLRVRSNPLGALHIARSLTAYLVGRPELPPVKYKTVSDFLDAWEINFHTTRTIPVPFLKREIGLGNVVRVFAERFPLWVKEKFDGCEDRRAWLNMLVAFVPWRQRPIPKPSETQAELPISPYTGEPYDPAWGYKQRGGIK